MRQSKSVNARTAENPPPFAPTQSVIALFCWSVFALTGMAFTGTANAQATNSITPRFPTPLTDAELAAKAKAAKEAAAQATKKAEQEKRDKAAIATSQQAAKAATTKAEALEKENARLKFDASRHAAQIVPAPSIAIAPSSPPTVTIAAAAATYTLLTPYAAYLGGPKLVPLPQTDVNAITLLGDNKSNIDNEKPAYRVLVNYNLSLGQTEVTHAQWQDCVADGVCAAVSDSGFGNGDKPVINVTFRDDTKKNDVASYLHWLNKKVKIAADSLYRYRLPTEAEWEYAARAGNRGDHSLGPDNNTPLSPQSANYNNHNKSTQIVARYPANKWKLHDMHGNVWEWVADCWQEHAYVGREKVPGGWRADILVEVVSSDGVCPRGYRGGSWPDHPQHLRSALRGWGGNPYLGAVSTMGFRLARTLP